MELSLITLGHVHEQDLAALTPHFTRLEQLVLDINPRDALTKHRPEFNRAVDAATADWILIMREPERIDENLAREIVSAATAAKAWGFRARTTPVYRGNPLRLPGGEGELRLFHKRHYLRFANKGEWDQPSIQGTVVWLQNTFRAITFDSPQAHREYLAKSQKPHSSVKRALVFARDVIATRTTDANTLRYIWIEAGFERG
ncbi:MAG TPA: hypothetical protein VM100_12960 [Longimicrobiales bacterium]|nr:hypothetical protein [Longimicrobiales bacterium]